MIKTSMTDIAKVTAALKTAVRQAVLVTFPDVTGVVQNVVVQATPLEPEGTQYRITVEMQIQPRKVEPPTEK